MLSAALDLLAAWGPLVGALGLPFALSSAALLRQQAREREHRTASLPETAAAWLSDQVHRRGLGVAVEIHRLDGLDAYWPGVGTIGLSQRTASGRGIHHWSVAAHELGHALNERAHPAMPHLLPSARLVSDAAWRTFGATLLVGALFGSWPLLLAGLAPLILAIAAGGVVVADEAWASRRGAALLADDDRVPRHLLPAAEGGMHDAFAVYAADLLGRVGVLALCPMVLAHAASLGRVAPAGEVWAPGGWLLVVMVPILALRTAQVLLQVFRPEPVGSDFRLFTVMHRDAQWAFLTGLGVLGLIGGLYDQAGGALFLLSVTLAATVALGPVAAIGRALALLPVMLLLRRLARDRSRADEERLFPEARPDGAAPALLALYSDPPWYLRVSWLGHLAWIPMVTLLVVHLLG